MIPKAEVLTAAEESGLFPSGGIKAFKVAEIAAAEATSQSFVPQYVVEL